MKKITLYLDNIKPITLNHCTKYRVIKNFVSTYKSTEYKDLIKEVNNLLLYGFNKAQIKKFNEVYNESENYLTAEYRFYYPILTKKNLISKRSMDWSNISKPIEDIIFKHLKTDDSQVVSGTVTKIHSEEIKTVVEYSIGHLSSIC